MNRRLFFWGLILGTLATRLAIDRGLILAEVPDALVAAVALGAAVLFVAVWALAFSRAPRRSATPPPLQAPAPSLEARLNEARRELAARSAQFVFTMDLLLTRSRDMDRLAAEQTAVASRLDAAQAAADRWRAEYERVATELQAERARFEDEQTRLAGETNALRVEVGELRAELERARSAVTALPAPAELSWPRARPLTDG